MTHFVRKKDFKGSRKDLQKLVNKYMSDEEAEIRRLTDAPVPIKETLMNIRNEKGVFKMEGE